MKSPNRYGAALAAMLVLAPASGLVAASGTSSGSGSRPAAETSAVDRPAPSVLPLTLEVSGDRTSELGTLRNFTITVQGEGDYAPKVVIGPVDPFTGANGCARPMPEGISGCVVNGDATVGTLRINWLVPEAGTYRFVLSGKRGTSDRVETIGAFDLEARD